MTSDIHELNLHSTSRAADGAYLAAIDVAEVANEHALEYRIVGGNAVTLLTVVHRVDHLVPGRETADADFGAPFPVVADPRLPAGLAARGYDRVEGNRFQRMRPDGKGELLLVVDVLAPSYEYRLKPNQRHGGLVVDEVPGLPLALARPPTTVALDLTLTGGERLSAVIRLPDVVAALCLKALAYQGRMQARDALDIWRLLEAAHAAGFTADRWPAGATATATARIIRQHFATPAASGSRNATGSPAQQARVRALALQVIPPERVTR